MTHVPIEPTVEGGWIPVEAGDGLRLLVQRTCCNDTETAGTRNEMRRTYFVSGKMGAGKTKAVLELVVDWMQRGVLEDATFLGPNRLLVEQVAQRVETLAKESNRHRCRRNTGVDVRRIFHGAPTTNSTTGNERGGLFTAACVDSVRQTPERSDVVIVDELAAIDFRNAPILHSIGERMRNARILFLLESALSKELLDACLEWRRMENEPLKSYIDREGVDGLNGGHDAKHWMRWLRKSMYFHTEPMINPRTKDVYRLVNAVRLAVYDPSIPTAIFTRFEEFPTVDELKADLLECANERKRAVVYVSSSRTGVQLTNMLAAVAPKVLTASAETMAAMGLEKMMNEMKTCRFLIATSVLCGGYSFEVQDVFDVAYAVFEVSINSPPLADMVHACGMVRCVGEKVLKYTVVSHPYAVPKQVERQSPE